MDLHREFGGKVAERLLEPVAKFALTARELCDPLVDYRAGKLASLIRTLESSTLLDVSVVIRGTDLDAVFREIRALGLPEGLEVTLKAREQRLQDEDASTEEFRQLDAEADERSAELEKTLDDMNRGLEQLQALFRDLKSDAKSGAGEVTPESPAP